MKLPTTIRHWLPLVLMLLIPVVFVSGTIALIQAQQSRLQSTLENRKAQLKTYQHYKTYLAEAQPVQKNKLRYDWQVAAWADSLSLELTLQPLNKDREVLNLSAEGPRFSLQQLLQLIGQYSRQSRWQKGWQLQRIGWSSASAKHQRLSWQVITEDAQIRSKAPVVTPPAFAHDDIDSVTCHAPPDSVPEDSPRLNQLKLIAVIQSRQTSGNDRIFWRTPEGQRVTTGLNDWFIDPIAQLIAIEVDRLQLKQWLLVNDCWLTRTYDHFLPEHD